MWTSNDTKSSQAWISLSVPSLAFASSHFPQGSWVCWEEEDSLSSKQLLNSCDVVSPVGHRLVLECHSLRQLTRGLVWKHQPRVFRPNPFLCPVQFWSSWVGGWYPEQLLANTHYTVQAVMVTYVTGNANFNPVVAQSKGRGTHLELNSVIEMSTVVERRWEHFLCGRYQPCVTPPWVTVIISSEVRD